MDMAIVIWLPRIWRIVWTLISWAWISVWFSQSVCAMHGCVPGNGVLFQTNGMRWLMTGGGVSQWSLCFVPFWLALECTFWDNYSDWVQMMQSLVSLREEEVSRNNRDCRRRRIGHETSDHAKMHYRFMNYMVDSHTREQTHVKTLTFEGDKNIILFLTWRFGEGADVEFSIIFSL